MSVVSIVEVGDKPIGDAVRRGVELAGGFGSRIRPGMTVLVKPNVVNASPSGSGKITDARVTEAVTEMVLACGPGKVVIGEGSSVGYDFPGRLDSLHCLEASGTADVARRLGVGMVDLNRDLTDRRSCEYQLICLLSYPSLRTSSSVSAKRLGDTFCAVPSSCANTDTRSSSIIHRNPSIASRFRDPGGGSSLSRSSSAS